MPSEMVMNDHVLILIPLGRADFVWMKVFEYKATHFGLEKCDLDRRIEMRKGDRMAFLNIIKGWWHCFDTRFQFGCQQQSQSICR